MRTSVTIGSVNAFPDTVADKQQALKPLEEAAEVFGAWQRWVKTGDDGHRSELLDEVADAVQACCNLAYSLRCDDMVPLMERCERRNRERGRYGSSKRADAPLGDREPSLSDAHNGLAILEGVVSQLSKYDLDQTRVPYFTVPSSQMKAILKKLDRSLSFIKAGVHRLREDAGKEVAEAANYLGTDGVPDVAKVIPNAYDRFGRRLMPTDRAYCISQPLAHEGELVVLEVIDDEVALVGAKGGPGSPVVARAEELVTGPVVSFPDCSDRNGRTVKKGDGVCLLSGDGDALSGQLEVVGYAKGNFVLKLRGGELIQAPSAAVAAKRQEERR